MNYSKEQTGETKRIELSLAKRSLEFKYTVLIIEDDANTREWLAEVLEIANYSVLKADNGKSGLELAQKHNPDVILCNVILPEFDGYQVLYLLSQNPQTAVISFIFLIGRAQVEDFNTRKGMNMGADDYLIHPFQTMDVLNAVESRIRKKETAKTYFEKSMNNIAGIMPNNRGLQDFEEMCKLCCSKVKDVKKKQVVYYEGDPVFGVHLITSGLIKTTKSTEGGHEMLTNIYGPQEYLGLTAMLLHEPYHETAQALENTSVSMVPKDLVTQLITHYPDLNKQFYKILINDIWEKEEQIMQLAYSSVRKRIASVLLRLIKHKNKGETDTPAVLEVSGDDLAAMAGVSKETVSRVLSSFKDEGYIKKDGSHIYVLDQIKMQQIKD